MKFNTAILYDIENLIGGYKKADMLTNLSLKDIFEEIEKKQTGKIAIQRAYANWSDPRLNILRGDIVELGIEPIQMFGFGKGSQKNASDIQLAIDAIDIAFTKQAIEVFVIVSGDGGFSSLANKLHEYGKMVIGCAYPKTTNKVFEAVSDDFIWIEEPKDESSKSHTNNTILTNDPIVQSYTKKNRPLELPSKDLIIRESKSIIEFLAENRDSHRLASNTGINISILSQLLDYRINNFSYLKIGFVKFIDYIRYITNESELKLIHKPPSEYRLLLSKKSLKGYESIPPITELNYIHTVDNYKKILSKGMPAFKQFSKEILFTIADFLAKNKLEFQNIYYGDIIDKLNNMTGYEQSEIKSTIASFLSAECFWRQPEEQKLSEQKLSLIPHNAEHIITAVEKGMQSKLEELLGSYDQETLNDILE